MERTLLLDDCSDVKSWRFSQGAEFPGARGSREIAESDGRKQLRLNYSFEKGGQYVATIRSMADAPAETGGLVFSAQPRHDCRVYWIVTDANGRSFRSKFMPVTAGKSQTFRIDLEKWPWPAGWAWGGKLKTPKPVLPLRELSLAVVKPGEGQEKSGWVFFGDLKVLPSADARQKRNVTELADFEFTTGGWSITGTWRRHWTLLDITCRNQGKDDAVLSLTFPAMGPDNVTRFNLTGKKTEYGFTYSPPWTGSGNPYNRYILKATLKTRDEELTRRVVLAGKTSNAACLGAPLNTKDIKNSIVGTNEHIGFAGNNPTHPQWSYWLDYPKLIDLMADAGIKWIRGIIAVKKDAQGVMHVSPWTLEWMSYAKGKNIDLVGQFYVGAKRTPEEVAEYCRAIAEDTKGLIDVFEIGNEPQNFAGWRSEKKGGLYSGSWNGMEKDGSTAEWVREFLKMTTIAVETIRTVRPDATIVGLGASPPVNHRMLDLGVPEELDGIAEHPYSKRLVPERVPFGLPFEKRDGIRVGDEKCSFLGSMNGMLEHSKKTGKERTMWLTEFGFATYWYDAPKAYDQYGQATELAQAVYTVRRFMQCLTVPEIKAACHYMFKDQVPGIGGGSHLCGLLRTDDSPKPAYYAVQRFTSLFNGYAYAPGIVVVEKTSSDAPRHDPRTFVMWDGVEVYPEPGVIAYGFVNPALPDERQLAVWAGRAVSGEWNSTFGSIRVKGWKDFGHPVAVDLITGKTFDVPIKADGSDLLLDLILTDNPLVVKLFRVAGATVSEGELGMATPESTAGRVDATGKSEKVVVCDFEDVGTWRTVGGSKGAEGRWFSGWTSLGGSREEQYHGRYVGALRYHFDAPEGPYLLNWQRSKPRRVKMRDLTGIEFFANPKGYDCSIVFWVIDAAKRRYRLPAVALRGTAWRRYSASFDAEHVPGYTRITHPVSLHQVSLEGSATGQDSVFVDDITLMGTLADESMRLSVRPVYEGLHYNPEQAVVLRYRLRNATGDAMTGRLTAGIQDFHNQTFPAPSQPFSVGAYGDTTVALQFGELPIGHYETEVTASTDSIHATYHDLFGVFVPNDGRVNRIPMWFGMETHLVWTCPGERDLHIASMRALGIDQVRMDMFSARMEHEEGNTSRAEGYTATLTALMENDIRVHATFGERYPGWLQKPDVKHAYRHAPNSYKKYEDHIFRSCTYLSKFPNVKYCESWNEPDIGFYHGTYDEFAEIQKAFCRGVRRANPNLLVTSGGSTVIHPREKEDFSRRMYTELSPHYDIYSFHAHGVPSMYVERQEKLERWIRESGKKLSDVRICNSETGQRSFSTRRGRKAQADTLVRKMVYARSRGNTEHYTWFTLQDTWDMDPTSDDSWGLMTSDLRVKPSLVAYNELIRQLANTRPESLVDLHDELTTYAFRHIDNGRTVHVSWSDHPGETVLVPLKCAGPVTVTNLFGKSREITPDDSGTVLCAMDGYPLYLTAETPISACTAAETEFVTFPRDVIAVPGEEVRFDIQLANTWGRDVGYAVRVVDDAQTSLGTYEGRIKAAETRRIPASFRLDDALQFGPHPHFVLVSVPDAGVQALPLPLRINVALPVVKVAESVVPTARRSPPPAARALVLDHTAAVQELTHDPFIPRWQGPDDLSVNARIAHDGHGLWFWFEVTDDRHVALKADADFWRDDSIQIAICSESGVHTEFGTLLKDGQEPESLVWCPISPREELRGRWNDVPVSIQRQANHTSYQLRVPFAKLGIVYRPGVPVRIAFLVNENDGQGRVRWIEWFRGIGRSKTPALFGHAVLE